MSDCGMLPAIFDRSRKIDPVEKYAAEPAVVAAVERAERMPPEPPQSAESRKEAHDEAHSERDVTLRQRAVPFIDMLRECKAAGREIVWGV